MEDLIVDINFVNDMEKGIEMDFMFGAAIGLISEYLEIGYYGTTSQTAKQTSLYEWIQKVNITDVGEYFIDVDNNYYVHVDEWTPSTHLAYCQGSIEDFRISLSYVHDGNSYACAAIIYNDMVRDCCKNHNMPPNAVVTAEASTICEAICKAVIKYRHGYHDEEMV